MSWLNPFNLVRDISYSFSSAVASGLVAGVGENVNTNKIFDAVSDIFSRMGKGASTAGSNVSEALHEFFKNFQFSKSGGAFGNEFKAMLDVLTGPVAQAMGDAVSQMGNHLSFAFLKSWAPTMLGFTIASTAIPYTIQYIYHRMLHAIGRPKLAIKERHVSVLTPFTDKIGNLFKSKQSKPVEAIFNADISRKITDITRAIPNIQKNKGFFQNVMLYGPGGTGKTMISEQIAKNANVNYVMMSGGDLPQYIKRGEHVTELNRLFNKIESSSKPTILFIDEAESFAADRGKIKTAELLELQNAFLNRTGTQSKKLMIIMATNRAEDIDPAILSRMDYKIFVGPPALKERTSILKGYAPQFFNEKERKAFFSDAQIETIAQKIDGFTGRAIFKLLNAIVCKKATTTNNTLTQDVIDQTVTDLAAQETLQTKPVNQLVDKPVAPVTPSVTAKKNRWFGC